MEIFDKETNEPVEVDITLINQRTGEKELIASDSKLITKYEVGQKYTLSLDAEGYDNSIVELRYNKFGTLTKSVYVSKTKPTVINSNLILKVLDEITLEPITATIMAINTTDPVNHASSLIALNEDPPAIFPLEVGQSLRFYLLKKVL